MSFLWQLTGMKYRRLGDETWQKEERNRVLQAAGTKPLREYINRSQAAVAEWVALQPIFEVYSKETVYEGGGRLREQWWRQTALEWQPNTTIKIFWQQRGIGGDRNLTGVVRARDERKNWALVVMGEVREDDRIFWYDGTETGESWVVG